MAAEDMKTKKRKGASDAAPKPKKQKKVDDTATTATRKSARVPKVATEPTDSPAAKVKSARKRAEDFLEDDEAPAKIKTVQEKKPKKKSKTSPAEDTVDDAAVVIEVTQKPKNKAKKNKEPVVEAAVEVLAEAPVVKAKKGKKAKQLEDAQAPPAEAEAVPKELSISVDAKKPKKTKKSKKQEEPPAVEVLEPVQETAVEDDEDLDDQTAALLAGFESDRDESDLEKEDEVIDDDNVPKLTKKQLKALENVRKGSEPGVVYLGRVPHGFFEPQMKKYFAQFGDVKRLRLSRNKKTGASKHYAFIEFRHGEVADIVAQAMNNYLMFGHILQCRVIPAEQVHEELFKGSNERFKVDPRNKKAGNAMARGAERSVWEKRVEKENKNRASRSKALQEEFDYSFSAPALRSVDAVPKKTLALEDEAEQQLLGEAPPTEVTEVVQVTESTPDQLTITETVKVKKTKKAAKSKSEPELEATAVADDGRITATNGKKEKKRKSDVAAEPVGEPIVAPKTKKAKKAKA